MQKGLVLLRLSVNFFLVTVNKLKVNFFFFKELNTYKPVLVVSLKQNKVFRVI